MAALGGPDGVLTGDDTGFERRGLPGRDAAAVHGHGLEDHQLPARRRLAYAGPEGRALAGRELYLPRSWAGYETRLAAARVPEDTAFQTKPQLLRLTIERAAVAGIPFRLGHGRRGLR